MRFSGGNRTRALVATLAVVSLLAACSSGESTAPQGTAVDDTAAGDVDPDGVVRMTYDLVAAARNGVKLDPTLSASSSADEGLLYLLYGRLLRPEVGSQTEFVPDLAESVTVVDPGTIDIEIREGVTFQDGTPFDAAAVKASLDRSLAADNRRSYQATFFELASVTVTGPTSLRLAINGGKAEAWYSLLGAWETTITPPILDPSDPNGAGPMSLTSWQPDQRMTLEKWDGYWDADSIEIGGMELVHVPSDETTTAVNAAQAGQADVAFADVATMMSLGGSLEADVTADPNRLTNALLCKRDEPLSDPMVRRALNKAVDREVISETLYEGTASPATQPWPEGHPYNDPDLAEELAYDPDEARQLLADAGESDATFDLYVLPSQGLPEVAAILKEQLAEVGVTVNLVPTTSFAEQFAVAQPPGAGLVPTARQGLARLGSWTGQTATNTCSYQNPEMDALAQQLATVRDGSPEAIELWHQVDDIVVSEALNLFVVFGSRINAVDTDTVARFTMWPLSNIVIPDARGTAMKAG
jgi:peptide/nickel transport system substrate-binding protein